MLIPQAVVQETGAANWISYTPTWSSTGTQPVINNGLIGGFYTRIGTLVVVHAFIVMGSGTTFGTGTYSLSYPIAELNDGVEAVGPSLAFDSSVSAFYQTNWRSQSFFNTAQPAVFMSNTAPFTWAQSDQLQASIMYRTA